MFLQHCVKYFLALKSIQNLSKVTVFFEMLNVSKTIQVLDVCLCTLCAGDRYIVADCGGGTVDLTVHQIEQPQGTLKELYKASGTNTIC